MASMTSPRDWWQSRTASLSHRVQSPLPLLPQPESILTWCQAPRQPRLPAGGSVPTALLIRAWADARHNSRGWYKPRKRQVAMFVDILIVTLECYLKEVT